MSSGRISELGLIQRIGRRVKNAPSVIIGIGDDAAVLEYGRDKYQLFTSDMLVEGVDFTRRTPAKDIGYKALACSLSDIAAMGGIPRYALVSLGIPKEKPEAFIDGFYSGLLKLARRFRVNIVGGDLSRSDRIVADVSLIGEVNKKRLVLRSGAKVNDILFVSGELGGSIYGRHLRFIPRLKESAYLVNNYKVQAMLDISDGLSLDLSRLCRASRVGAVVYEELIPVSKEAKGMLEALNMGEDFELLFSLPLKEARRLIKSGNKIFKAIGEIRPGREGVKIISRDSKARELTARGYQHF
ncbi:MAG TPA: thiamine-phosphate kinase [Candidatus Omnitrophota bacterium]|nr:thiamine-phosphate kinase [Candidatus Omnitrophota bacterium]